jgi:hypothetical protein
MKPDSRYDAIVRRLGQHVASVQRKYPDIWKQVDQLRAERGKTLPKWPAWCFLPLAGAYAIITGGRDDIKPTGSDIGVVGALAAWRITKGIYDFDPTVLDELWKTPVDGDIPAEVLDKLPEWCCYVPFDPPRRLLEDEPDCHGFFVHLEHDQNDGRRELRFLLDLEPLRLTAVPLHLVGNLADCVQATMVETLRQFRANDASNQGSNLKRYLIGKHPDVADEDLDDLVLRAIQQTAERMPGYLASLISITLYLCSTTAEILGRDGRNRPLNRPLLTKTKGGMRMFAAQQMQMWEVGYRLGATLRASAPGVSGPDRGGAHATPRPHIRRAHWHAFWTGPKAKGLVRETDRKLILKWLPPIYVAMGDEGHVIPTIHRVAGT